MTMLYSFHENPDFSEQETQFEFVPSAKKSKTKKSEIHLFAEKLCVPGFEDQLMRPRLNELLAKSLAQFGTTLVTGRAGTGKTALASDFARRYERVSWYSIDSSESDWEIFSRYFTASFDEKNLNIEIPKPANADIEENLEEIAYFTERLTSEVAEICKDKKHLIVLDDAHYLFDSDWFTTFFHSLVNSLTPNIHLIILCRGNPSLPLWRLRSKQVLGVIDEKVLNFNFSEAQDLLGKYEISPETSQEIYNKSFGRISKLKKMAKTCSSK